jgi:ABC-type transport system involved in multi-copper enzyme maturation permease subunit
MIPTFTLAQLTIKEAIRRRFIWAAFLICGFFFVIAFAPIHPRATLFLTQEMAYRLTGAVMALQGGHMVEFFAFLFAVALSSGTISNEIERGVLAVIVPKPIPRLAIYLGKWLGINLFILPCVIAWVAILQWAIVRHVGYSIPELWRLIGVMMLYPLVFSSLTVFFSSFTSHLLSMIMPLILASTAWSEDFLKAFGYGFDINALKTAAKIVVYVAPLNPMSRWYDQVLDQPILQIANAMRRQFGALDPPANHIDLAWILGYALVALLAGAIIFQKRDL